MKYINAIIKMKTGYRINEEAMERRKRFIEMDYENMEVNGLKDELKRAKKEWQECKRAAKSKKEEKLMELYPHEIANDTDENKKRRKKAIKPILKT